MFKFNRKVLLVAVLSTVAMSGVGYAIWAAGWSVTGNVVHSGGTQPDLQIQSNVLLSGDAPGVMSYVNQNGAVNMTVTCSADVRSTNHPVCRTSEADLSLMVRMGADGEWMACSSQPIFRVESGTTDFYYKAVPHVNACPYAGTLAINGIIS